ncbi:Uncharacterised protein [Mycobacteroides abscessus subsp. abscessus]|nr:Uncharacterised protein [Mycobacteroides abscessus subsp. abscessus]
MVRTSHSLSRLGYFCSALGPSAESPLPGMTASPSTVPPQPAEPNATSATHAAANSDFVFRCIISWPP